MEQLETSGKVTYAYLGVQGQTLTADVAHLLGVDVERGVLIADVSAGSPAADAGLRGGDRQQALQGQVYVTGGDVITEIDGKAVDGMEELAALITQHKPGDTLTLTIVRGGATEKVAVTLAERPSNP